VYEFKLPDLGEGIHEGEILKWYVAVGDTVEEDAPLVDVETDKAAVTIPSPRGGRVARLAGEVGATVLVGAVLAVIDSGEEPAVLAASESPRAHQGGLGEPSAAGSVASGGSVLPIPAAPATRRLARELGVDLRNVTPSGPAGRVLVADVRLAAQANPAPPAGSETTSVPPTAAPASARPAPATAGKRPTPAPAGSDVGIPFYQLPALPDFTRWGEVRREPLRSIRRKIARHMTTAKLVVPHVAHMDDADVTRLYELTRRLRERYAERPGGRLGLLPFVVRAVVAGLREWPMFNASLDPFAEEIVYKGFYNVGVAVDTPRGLMVPVVHGAERAPVLELSARIEHLAGAAREGSLGVDDLRGGTFTISNIGPLGGRAVVPAVHYPEVAILGLGRASEQAVVRDGEIVVRRMLPLTLAFDHRVADGADAARFVGALMARLEDPERLLVEA